MNVGLAMTQLRMWDVVGARSAAARFAVARMCTVPLRPAATGLKLTA